MKFRFKKKDSREAIESLLKQALMDRARMYSLYMTERNRYRKACSQRDRLRNELEKYMRAFPAYSLTKYLEKKIEDGDL